MSWEIAVVFVLIAVAICMMIIGIKGNEKQLPLKLIFITAGLGFLLFALQTNVLLITANNSTMTPIVYNDLVSVSEGAYKVMLYMFWIFIAITTLSVLFTAVDRLRRR